MRRPLDKSETAPTRAGIPAMARPVWLMAALLLLVTIGLYWPATRCDFINYDDPDFVTANPHVQGGLNWEGVKWAFRNTERAAYWAPLMWLSHMLAWQLFGMSAWGHHLINVLLHAVNTVLVFLLFRSMTGATWRSAILAALFGLHPLRLESVAWVTERKDVLSTCLGFLALIFYARYARGRIERESEQKRRVFSSPLSAFTSSSYWLAFIFYLLGLLSKPMLVTWPFVMLLLDYWPLRRFELSTLNSQLSTTLRLMTEKIPFFALAVAASAVTFVVQTRGGGVIAAENLPLGARSGNALISYCRYLGKLFWPTDLAVFYPHPGHWPLVKVLLAGGLIVGISVLLFGRRRRSPFLLMGWLWFVGTLVPVIGLIQSGDQALADRFTYIPSLGVLILVIWGAYELTRHWRYRVIALPVACSAVIVLCLALTRQQLRNWKDSEALFRHALEVTENNYLAHETLGDALDKKGQTDEAISQFQEAIHLKPDDARAHNNLGNALVRKGQMDAAISQFQEAIHLQPDDTRAHNNLGIALVRKGQMDAAISQYQEAIRLQPGNADAHYNLGIALGRKGQMDVAISQFQEAIRLQPDNANAHINLGVALGSKGQLDAAISQFQEAIRLQPDNADARKNLDLVLNMKADPARQKPAATNH